MLSYITTVLATAATLASAAALPVQPRGQSASMTPHDQYSSSIGVVGCLVNTNRIAYWPGDVDCDNICVKVSNEGRSVYLLKVDSSGGAYDISYDAWNYLGFGKSATEEPHQGGGLAFNYEYVSADNCADLMDDGKLPLTASNSMNYLASCLNQPNSFVAKNHRLVNVLDPVCHWGVVETCQLDLSVSNQPKCPSGLGNNAPCELSVYNIQYGTGDKVTA